MSGATFIGAGTPSGTNQTIRFGGTPGSGLDFTVLSATTVLIHSIFNSTVAIATPAQINATTRTAQPVAKKPPAKKLPTLPDMSDLPKRFGRASRLANAPKSK